MDYQRRFIDDELDELFGDLPAIALEGPKAVGKTATARQRSRTVFELDQERQRVLLDSDPQRLDQSPPPVLLDEWQRLPSVWDLVRRSVDANSSGGRFLLAGSANPKTAPSHSGAGRIVSLRMRPLSLAERSICEPTVKLSDFLSGAKPRISGESPVGLRQYVDEIIGSGFPGIRRLSDRARMVQLDSYLDRLATVEFVEHGTPVKRAASLRAWMTAYAAATATTASYNSLLDAATPGDSDKPARSTTEVYRNTLSSLFLLDPVPGWVPVNKPVARLAQAPKHHLADPALAGRLLGVTSASLLSGDQPEIGGPSGFLLGNLFESLVALCLRVYAQPSMARVSHLRTKNGDHEVDFVVEGPDHRVVAIEVKVSPNVSDSDVRHLHWLANNLGTRRAEMVMITTGTHAYRRKDGVAVVPLALLTV
jgi:uncharacterized protein